MYRLHIRCWPDTSGGVEAVSWQQVLVTLVASLLSGILGVGVSTWYYRRHERYRSKMDTLTRLFGYRFDIVGPDFSRALNEVFVVFHDSPLVLAALQDFHLVTVSRQGELANDKLVSLFTAMCQDVRTDPHTVNDSFYLQPFNTAGQEGSRDQSAG